MSRALRIFLGLLTLLAVFFGACYLTGALLAVDFLLIVLDLGFLSVDLFSGSREEDESKLLSSS